MTGVVDGIKGSARTVRSSVRLLFGGLGCVFAVSSGWGAAQALLDGNPPMFALLTISTALSAWRGWVDLRKAGLSRTAAATAGPANHDTRSSPSEAIDLRDDAALRAAAARARARFEPPVSSAAARVAPKSRPRPAAGPGRPSFGRRPG
ncbi:hypothetical protein [Mangrovibrevibacter kandeliae]|uniref:hypothetical protein n=1 Tax=Mangrovibrevibacter kandeliae TaxID=2968473 RepID=UPI0021194B1F|nr:MULTISPECIES: hypothetical protein [unclassified Aurantimonas]MCQ8783631.1 hypothetical protein [Aurantimonas sp. CSK15Z-1]MCW4116408.1 hypothetical protein [Aurantimonas sp. MSK8Z-1]